MKILLVGNYILDRQFSMLGFADAFYKNLPMHGHEVRQMAPVPRLGSLSVGSAGARKWLAYIDKYLLFPRELRRAARWADVVHICDHSNAIYTKQVQFKPHVVTCHDVLAIRASLGQIRDWTTGATGRMLQTWILQGLNDAQFVVCDSQTTQKDLLSISKIPTSRMRMISVGVLRPISRMPDAESQAHLGEVASKPFLLHIGGNLPYKNRLGVLKIYKALRENEKTSGLHLVMAGMPFSAELRDFVLENGLSSSVIERITPSDEEIRALYSRAVALVFPSLYEGFGLPIIEAQACGCPVFTSNRGPMTEVGGDAAVYFDPEQPAQAAQVIASHLDSLQPLRDAGTTNISRFTTARMIDEYLQVYSQVAGTTSRRT